MKLTALTLRDAQQARHWRNEHREALRTPFLITDKQQEEFYNSLTRNSNMRYWGIEISGGFGGMGGLTGIEWENRIAEISLIIDPLLRRKGYGAKAVELILHEGFGNMGLATIYGECYECNPALPFWQKLCIKYRGYTTILPRRKFWAGRYYDSLYFSLSCSFSIGGDVYGFDNAQEQVHGADYGAKRGSCGCGA